MPYTPLNWAYVAERRNNAWLGHRILYQERIDSTNRLAERLSPDQAPPGTVIIADFQSQGRGRLQRQWLAEPGSALLCTSILGPITPLWAAPMIAGLAVLTTLQTLHLPVRLKWPNDVLLAGRKCAGILIETRRVEATPWILVGIGINVRIADPSLPDAGYLDALAATPIRRETLLVDLLAHLEQWRNQVTADVAVVRDAWRSNLATLGQRVTITTAENAFSGIATDVAEDGALIVALPDGTTRIVQAGDVTLSTAAPVATRG